MIETKNLFSTQLTNIMTVRDLKMHFPVTKGLLKHPVGAVKAVDGVSFDIKRGQTLGLVGESGSGKSTIGNCLIHRIQPTSGDIVFEGTNLKNIDKKTMRLMRRAVQMITQDPFASLDLSRLFRRSDAGAAGLYHDVCAGADVSPGAGSVRAGEPPKGEVPEADTVWPPGQSGLCADLSDGRGKADHRLRNAGGL